MLCPSGNKVWKTYLSIQVIVQATRSLTFMSYERTLLVKSVWQIWSFHLFIWFKIYREVLSWKQNKILFTDRQMDGRTPDERVSHKLNCSTGLGRPFRRQITGLVLNVSFWPELEHKMAFVYARKDDVPVSDDKLAINKKNILTFMVLGDSMYLLFCVLSIEIGWHFD